MDLTAVDAQVLANPRGEIPGLGKDEKLLLVCAKGKRAYLLQNRMKHYGYTNTRVLEGSSFFNVIRTGNAAGQVTVSPEEITRVKALGCLHNKGTDNFNVRVITRNGKVTAEENRRIADAAAQVRQRRCSYDYQTYHGNCRSAL